MDWGNNKPRYIEALHTAPITFDLEELGIDFDSVKDYDIKYGDLTVTFKDGTIKTYTNGDVGYAYQETIYDSDWYEVEGLN
jgi:coenzyme F420-reducing hydrogenase beta subunit